MDFRKSERSISRVPTCSASKLALEKTHILVQNKVKVDYSERKCSILRSSAIYHLHGKLYYFGGLTLFHRQMQFSARDYSQSSNQHCFWAQLLSAHLNTYTNQRFYSSNPATSTVTLISLALLSVLPATYNRITTNLHCRTSAICTGPCVSLIDEHICQYSHFDCNLPQVPPITATFPLHST